MVFFLFGMTDLKLDFKIYMSYIFSWKTLYKFIRRNIIYNLDGEIYFFCIQDVAIYFPNVDNVPVTFLIIMHAVVGVITR